MFKRPVLMTSLALMACSPSQEAAHVQLGVVLDGSALAPATTDLGWSVELSRARVAASDLQFTIQGEMHGASAGLGGWLISRAWAHPGHYAGGDVNGELVGDLVLDWTGGDGTSLGVADLLVGDYNGLNFGFRAATAADGLAADDPLLGHVAHFVGVARKGADEVGFTAVLDLDAGAQLVGAPFAEAIDVGATGPIALRLVPGDPVEGKSLFDGLDFAQLDADADGLVDSAPGDPAHNILRRSLQSHVHYQAELR